MTVLAVETKPSIQRKIVHIEAKPGSAAELREALLELEAATRGEPGCIAFSFFQALSSAGHFLLIEEFASPAALEEHLSAPYTRAFFTRNLTAAIAPVDKGWLS